MGWFFKIHEHELKIDIRSRCLKKRIIYKWNRWHSKLREKRSEAHVGKQVESRREIEILNEILRRICWFFQMRRILFFWLIRVWGGGVRIYLAIFGTLSLILCLIFLGVVILTIWKNWLGLLLFNFLYQ